MIIASAPTRLDFGGGWTDVPPYAEERGGFVCNIAIDRRATVTLGGAEAGGRAGSPDPLAAAALRYADRQFGPPPRSGAIRAGISNDFPVGAGLGGSSAAGVALAAGLHAAAGVPATPERLSEWSRAVEVEELGIAGGRQDHYAAAYGGALGLTFGDGVHVEQVPLSAACVSALESQITLVYTGETRISAETITAVLNAYVARVAGVVQALDRMAVLARAMRSALHSGDVATLGLLVNEHWIYQRSLHPRITTARIDALEAAARRAGASAIKALGASGGGCVMIFGGHHLDVAIAGLGERLTWRVATQGVRVEA